MQNPNSTPASPATEPSRRGVLVLGLGNILLTDEGAGCHVVNALAARHADMQDVAFVDGGTLSFSLAGTIVDNDALIVVDTAALGAPPGTVRVFEGDAMDHFVSTGGKSSVHEVSLADLLAITLLEGKLPDRRALVGIQPQNFDWGDQPTEAVRQGMPLACEAVMQIVERWRA
jgi:hydrogenase maturation protease